MNEKKPSWGGAGRSQGRKPLSPDSPTIPVTIKMSLEQREKLLRLGGAAWVRARIDKAKEPTD